MTERDFLVDINPDINLPEYNLVLYSLYEQPITELYNITDFNIKPFFIGIDEISFNIPMTRNEVDGQIVRNEIYDMVDGEYYILLNGTKFFVVNKINEKTNDDGFTYKEVSAYSREFELTQKKVVDYKANSRMLYDRNNTMLKDEESGLTIERGVLNYIFNHVTKGWTIGTVDEKVVSLTNEGISRALNFSNSNLIQVFQELQKTYNCIFKFDTINQVVDVESMLDYELDIDDIANSPQYKGLYISDENFIKNMSKNIEYDKVKTRLYLYGKDNISIQTVTPVGLPYIDNFTTFKNTKFMTQELIDKLNEYEVLVTNANPNFQPKREALQLKHQELEDLYNADDIDDFNKKGLIALQRQLSLVQTEIDTRVENLAIIKNTISSAEGIDLEDLYTQMKTVQSEIDAFENQKANIKSLITTKESQIETKNNEIKAVETEIQAIKDNLSVQATLSPKLIKELDKFIRVETYNDSNFTENNIMELYEEGKKNLAKISQPSIQFDVDVVDFLSIVECQHAWDKFVLGDIVLLENKNIGFSYYVRLVGYEHNPDDNSLSLQFSNTNSFDDATLWIKDLLEQMSNTTSTLDFNKYKWDKTEDMQDRISKMVDEKLEEARQNILNAVGQKHLFDDSGLWLYKENPDGNINPEQIRAINNTIALTENNWKTVGTAITPKGVVAPSIYGKLGRFALIQANKIEVGGDFDYDWSITQPAPPYQIGQTWLDNGVSKICVTERLEGVFNPDDWKLTITSHIDKETKELDDAINELDEVITSAFSDGSITNIEANSLSLSRDSLVKEANDVKAIATSLEVSTINITTAINNLNTEVNKYVGQSNYPIVVLPTDRINITNAFTALEGSITQLYKTIDEKRAESITVHQILLSNENQSIVTDSSGIVKTATSVSTNIDVYRGITKIAATIGTPLLKNKDGTTISFGTITKTNPTTIISGSIAWTIPINTNLPTDSGWIEIPLIIEGKSYTKKLFWNKAKAGQQGYTPVKGTDYFDGSPGQDGESKYLWIRYSQNANGNPFTDSPTDAKYIGIATTITNNPPAHYLSYTWSLIKGTDGIPGEPGTNGQTSYLHIKYSDNGTSFTANNGETVGIYIGTYVDFIETDSMTFSKYKWNKVKGEQGQDGSNAKIVTITPSHSAFISKSIESPVPDSSYEPANINIAPSFQNCVYSKWEYSTDGETWTQITRTTTSTTLPYISSSTRVLTIPRLWSVYSSSQTFVIFKVTSTTNEYDLITIPRLYDANTLNENALKQNFYYNRTKITEAEGIEVYDNLGNKVLQMGGFDSDGNGTKDMYGFVAPHTDGSYTALVKDGLIRRMAGSEHYYLSNVYAINGETLNVVIGNMTYIDIKPLPVRIILPKSMRNRDIKISVSLRGFEVFSRREADINGASQWTETYLDIVDKNLSAETPYVDVEGYTRHNGLKAGTQYRGIQFLLLAVGS